MRNISLATVIQACRWIWNTLLHQIIAVVAIYTIWIPIHHYYTMFSWHVILCSFGLLPLMTESLVLFPKENISSQVEKRRNWHEILMFIASSLIVIGIVIEIDRIAQFNDIRHFTSTHAIIGFLSMIFIIFSFTCGSFAFGCMTTIWAKYAQPEQVKLAHNVLVQIGYFLGIVCLCFGYYTAWFSFYTSNVSRIAATIGTVVAAVWSLIYAWKSMFKLVEPSVQRSQIIEC